MATEIRMPKLGMSMTEGTISDWLVADGATVAAGDPIVLIETDKVEQEVEAPEGGTIQLRASQGTTLDVGELIAEIV